MPTPKPPSFVNSQPSNLPGPRGGISAPGFELQPDIAQAKDGGFQLLAMLCRELWFTRSKHEGRQVEGRKIPRLPAIY